MLRAVLQALACLALAATATAAPLPEGESRASVLLGGTPVAVAYYKPRGYAGGPLLVSLHGLGRNVDGYLAATRPLADRHGLLVAVPLFDRERFPPWRYQWLGVSRTARTGSGDVPVEPRAQWTTALIGELAEQVSAAEGRPLELWLTGHSAGGQAAGRYAALAPGTARRIVVANPSSWLMPTREARYPYGFGGLPDELADDAALRLYLAQPLTILAGTGDVLTRDLDQSPPAMLQGATRLERARHAYRAGAELAQRNGWAFNWRLVEVPGVGHSVAQMYATPEAFAALTREPRNGP
jgi:poly(3-hydroxybutyrate) depolymerase